MWRVEAFGECDLGDLDGGVCGDTRLINWRVGAFGELAGVESDREEFE